MMNSGWKWFRLGDYFDVKKGKRLTSEDQTEGNNIYVGAIDSNNGVANYIGQAPIHDGNTISLSYNGSVGEAFYQPEPYWATDDVNALYPKFDNFNRYNGLFVVTILRQEKYKYSYGRKWTLENMEDTEIMLPADSDGNPNWQFMEDYIKSLHHKPLTTKNNIGQVPELNIQKWKEFRVGDLFPKKRCNHFSATPESEGKIPFISSTSNNNGVATMVDEESIEGNCITVSTNGDCFDCFYQPDPIVVSNDVEVLYGEHINPYTAMFINTVLMQEKIKWSYGRKPKNDKVYDTIIKLPTDIDGNPDWQFMENYIKSFPYGDRI